jgi:hypothetical protein
MPVNPELLRAISEGKRNLGKAERLSTVGSAKDNVGHFSAAHCFGRLLTQDPADSVEDIGLAAPIRTDDRGDAFVKFENRLIKQYPFEYCLTVQYFIIP